jgi:hypothetical protein
VSITRTSWMQRLSCPTIAAVVPVRRANCAARWSIASRSAFVAVLNGSTKFDAKPRAVNCGPTTLRAVTIASPAAANRSLLTVGFGNTKVIALPLISSSIVRLMRTMGLRWVSRSVFRSRLISVVCTRDCFVTAS